jgi:hypothetical protein
MDQLLINTKTTGFGSPARAYAKKRLDANELLIKNPYTTYFFKWEGESKLGLETGDILVIDRSFVPELDDLVLFSGEERIQLEYFKNIEPDSLWGTVVWKLTNLKK